MKEYLIDPAATNVTKSFKNKIKKNQFKLVTLGSETNVVCTTVDDSELEGNQVRIVLFFFVIIYLT